MKEPPSCLFWKGPHGISDFSSKVDLANKLKRSGVYIYLRKYKKTGDPHHELTIAYAGRDRNLSQRMKSHFVSTLGLGYWLYNENGENFDNKQHDVFYKLDNIEVYHRIAVQEVKRISFYYALIDADFIRPVENLLVKRLKYRAESRAGLDCENERIPSYGKDKLSLTLAIKGNEEIRRILGESPLKYVPE